MYNKWWSAIILLVIILMVSLAIGLFYSNILEGNTNLTDTSSSNTIASKFSVAQQDAAKLGVQTGSGVGITADPTKNISYAAPTDSDFDKLVNRKDDPTDTTYNYNVDYRSKNVDNKSDKTDGNAWVYDKTGKLVALPDVINTSTGAANADSSATGAAISATSGADPGITYYTPGSYKFGASSYVPSYEDSVYLSKSTGQTYMAPIRDTAAMLGGICEQYKNDPLKLEEACLSTNKNTCGSTSCCALLGGSKCVSGNEYGPIMKENYGDITVRNRDFYYFKGKCYGNCV